MKRVIICQARMGSTRFPGKVLKPLDGLALMGWTVRAAQKVELADKVIVATSTLPADDAIEEWCLKSNVACFRGSESNVLDRCYWAAKNSHADIVVRLTCDCPFIDPNVVTEVLRLQMMTGADYVSNVSPPSYPDGLDVECMTMTAIEEAHKEVKTDIDKDCWPQFIQRNRYRFKAANLRCPLPGMEKERWVCDTEKDYEFCQKIAEKISVGAPYTEILAVLDKEPELRQINTGIRNERFYESLSTERLPPRTFERSERILARARKVIPFGAQTFSKSHIQFPAGRAPLYVSHGDGARIFDVDGNDYVDLVSAILPVVLGYRDPDVDEAIRRQLDNGISFSLATELEYELADLLSRLIPSAHKVKFGKSGSDVTTAAIRLARAYRKCDMILLSGYHGWHDWSMAKTDRNLGIPEAIRNLSHRINYGDEEHTESVVKEIGADKIAAIIVEPDHNPEYLKFLRGLCDRTGIVLIFDEVITGFRYSIGGAQLYYGVTPDVSTFGKAMANGMPLAAVVGRSEIMKLMEPPNNIFYSGTMFGEALSLAASIATIKKMLEKNVIKHLWDFGADLANNNVSWLIKKYRLEDYLSMTGEAPWMKMNFAGPNKDQIRTMFMTEMIQNGVLMIASHNISFSHGPTEMKRIVTAYDNTLGAIREALTNGTIEEKAGQVVASAPLRTTA